jgi:prepilin-type processing-associated H-X9-DG protein
MERFTIVTGLASAPEQDGRYREQIDTEAVMEENFVGYVLNALDPDAQRKVETYLHDNPEGQRQVELLRQALEPLRADAEEIEPPPGLAIRTLACVAEYCCRDLPRAPAPSQRFSDAGQVRWWRRADFLVAASILLCIGLLIPPVVSRLQHQHELASCTENLSKFGSALAVYSDRHHGAFPNVAAPELGKRKAAGMAVPMLLDDGVIKRDDLNVRCPGNGEPRDCRWTVDALKALSDEDFEREAPRLSCCYAYSLGYQKNGRIHGLSRDLSFPVPIMADRPPFREGSAEDHPENSPNHGGGGQNVLFTDGHVAFLKGRTINGDDIFLNQRNQVGAGLNAQDTVLGVSEARPRMP